MGERKDNSCFSVIQEKRCTGCGNCSRICPKHCLIMAKDKAGFTVSKIADSDACLNCGACKAVCPELSARQALPVKSLPKCYAAWHKDADIVRKSSSGGVFTAFASYVIDHGGWVAGVVMENNAAKYIISNRHEDLSLMRGSKYIPADFFPVMDELIQKLRSGDTVLAVLLPCAAAALRKLVPAGKFPGKLYVIDMICAGVPSPYYFQLETSRRKMTVSRFRCKSNGNGWRKSQGLWGVDSKSGADMAVPVSNSPFYNAFACGQILRQSCYDCRHADLERASDITIGDFWGESRFPEQENDGISMIMINSAEGNAFLEEVSGQLNIHPALLSDAARKNPRLIFGKDLRSEYFLRKIFLKIVDRLPFFLLKFFYGGGYKRKFFNKLPYRIFWRKNARHRKLILKMQQEAFAKLTEMEKGGCNE